jgi:hypothetical protein
MIAIEISMIRWQTIVYMVLVAIAVLLLCHPVLLGSVFQLFVLEENK